MTCMRNIAVNKKNTAVYIAVKHKVVFEAAHFYNVDGFMTQIVGLRDHVLWDN